MGYSVILIDDEPVVVDSIRRHIKWDELGYDIAGVFYDGKDALEFLERTKVDLVLTDIEMPYVSGIDVCKWLRENAPNTKVVILSGHANFNYAAEAMRYNAVDYILKTSMLAEISEKLVRVRDEHLAPRPAHMISDERLWADIPQRSSNYIIKNALLYVQEHFDNDISLKAVAEHLNLSMNYFSNLFKAETGINFNNYITQLKIDHAKELLRSTTYKVYEIGAKIGYKSERFFSDTFKSWVGCTPTEYRNKLTDDSKR
ncbi:putative two-component response regulator [Clostridia bacterium]|nr:putative two-component response regulator [Clostridia bacterium]